LPYFLSAGKSQRRRDLLQVVYASIRTVKNNTSKPGDHIPRLFLLASWRRRALDLFRLPYKLLHACRRDSHPNHIERQILERAEMNAGLEHVKPFARGQSLSLVSVDECHPRYGTARVTRRPVARQTKQRRKRAPQDFDLLRKPWIPQPSDPEHATLGHAVHRQSVAETARPNRSAVWISRNASHGHREPSA
jgi:hypothetical protein